MQVTSKPIMVSELIVGEQQFEVVQQFKYLGTIVTNDNNLDKEIRLELIYLYFPPSSHLIYVCFCPVGLSLL